METWEIEILKRDINRCKSAFPNPVYDSYEIEGQIDRVLEQVIPDALEIADWLLYEADKDEVTQELIKDLRKFAQSQIVFLTKLAMKEMAEAPQIESWLRIVTITIDNFYRTAVNLLDNIKHTATD